jgi:tRNA nucleotidyltransferase (CCA-adding enzyme)
MIAKKEFLRQISAERIREELTKILISDHPELLVMAYELGITKIILPEWDEMMETPQNNPHHLYSVGLHSLKGIQQIEPNVHLRYAMLLHDAGKPACKTTDDEGIDHFTKHPLKSKDIAREVLRRLKFDNETVKVVTTLVEWHDWRFMKATDINKKAVRRLANKIGVDLCYQLFKVQHADIMAQSDYQKKQKLDILEKTKSLLDEIVADQECITLKDLKLNGKDLIAMGVQPGKQIGVILNSLLDLVLEQPELNTEEYLTTMAEEMLKGEQ